MLTMVDVDKLQVKSAHSPDEVRTPDKTRVEVVRFDTCAMARFRFEPGWRWSDCIKPVAGTETCQVSHVGYALSGTIQVKLQDGTEMTIRGGDFYTIPPGHDGWVVGTQPFIGIEVMSAEHYARH